jgi:hypothetical protein
MLAGVVVLDPAIGLGCGIGADGDSGLAVDRVGGVLQFCPAGIDIISAVAGGIEGVSDICQDRIGYAELFQDALVFAVITGIEIAAGDQIQLAGAAALDLLPFGQGMES